MNQIETEQELKHRRAYDRWDAYGEPLLIALTALWAVGVVATLLVWADSQPPTGREVTPDGWWAGIWFYGIRIIRMITSLVFMFALILGPMICCFLGREALNNWVYTRLAKWYGVERPDVEELIASITSPDKANPEPSFYCPPSACVDGSCLFEMLQVMPGEQIHILSMPEDKFAVIRKLGTNAERDGTDGALCANRWCLDPCGYWQDRTGKDLFDDFKEVPHLNMWTKLRLGTRTREKAGLAKRGLMVAKSYPMTEEEK